MWRGIYGFKAPYGVVHGFLGATSYLKKKKKKKKKRRELPKGQITPKKKKKKKIETPYDWFRVAKPPHWHPKKG
jgi:hypothetical protein